MRAESQVILAFQFKGGPPNGTNNLSDQQESASNSQRPPNTTRGVTKINIKILESPNLMNF